MIESREPRFLWLVAVGVGGTCGLAHLMGRSFSDDMVGVGQLGLYAAPLLFGVLAGLYRRDVPAAKAMGLAVLCLVVATPMLGEGALCLVVILPVNLVIAPSAALITSAVTRARRKHLPDLGRIELMLLVVPFAAALANRLAPPEPAAPVTMVDSVVADAPIDAVWRSIDRLQLDFVEPPPWMVSAGMPVPREIRGGGASPGAERRVVFSNGTVLATVTEATAPTHFAVALSVEDSGPEFFDHWSVLGDSTFDLERLADGRTRITHSTTYRPLSYPRWYFEPIEQHFGRLVQRHMLEAYARQTFPPALPVAAR